MKTPKLTFQGGTGLFIENAKLSDINELTEFVIDSVYRAQQMASAGLRHLSVILGANKNKGKKDRWRKDALAQVYFGKISSVADIRAVRRRLERAHRRLRDNQLQITLKGQGAASKDTTAGHNGGFFISPRCFELFPVWAGMTDSERASIIIHELLHEWLTDKKIGNQTVRGDSETRRLASRDPYLARHNPENYEHFCMQVWLDEGIDAPSGAEKIDSVLKSIAINVESETGQVLDRPDLVRFKLKGQTNKTLAAVHGKGDDGLHLIGYKLNTRSARMLRFGEAPPSGAIDGSPKIIHLGSDRFVTAVRHAGYKRLMLILWKRLGNELKWVSDSGSLFGDIYDTPNLTWTGRTRGGNEGIAVSLKGKSGRLKVVGLMISRDGVFDRFGDAETSGKVSSSAPIAYVGPNLGNDNVPKGTHAYSATVTTAFKTEQGRLSVDSWLLNFGARRVERRGGLVDRSMTGVPAIASLCNTGITAVAVRDDNSGRLRLTHFDLSNSKRPRRLCDTNNVGIEMNASPAICVMPMADKDGFATAVQDKNGKIRVSIWALANNKWQRIAISEPGAKIFGSPSVTAADFNDSGKVDSVSRDENGRFYLQRWKL